MRHLRERFAPRRRATVVMHGDLFGLDPLLVDALLEQLGGELARFAMRQHPAHRVAAEEVEQHVELVVGPLLRGAELGDVPRPHLVRTGRQELGTLIARMTKLISALTDLAAGAQNPIHRAGRAMVDALAQQRTALDKCATGLLSAVITSQGLAALDSSRSECEWGTDDDAPPGLMGFSELPRLRTGPGVEYVSNSNDSYWLQQQPDPRW